MNAEYARTQARISMDIEHYGFCLVAQAEQRLREEILKGWDDKERHLYRLPGGRKATLNFRTAQKAWAK